MASFPDCCYGYSTEMIVRKWFKPFDTKIMLIFLIQCQYNIIVYLEGIVLVT